MKTILVEILLSWARAALVAAGTFLVTHHVLTAAQGDALTGELLTHLALAAPIAIALIWSAIQKYGARVKFLTALELPAGTSEEVVKDKVANGTGATIAAVAILVCLGAGATLPACASAPPKGTYSTVGEHAWQADQLLKDLTAISQTAINLNAQPIGTREHLSDRDTALVRDYSLVAGAALNAYGSGATTLEAARTAVRKLDLPPGLARAAADAFDRAAAAYGQQASVLRLVVDTFNAFEKTLSADANQNPKLLAALATVAAAVNSIPIQ